MPKLDAIVCDFATDIAAAADAEQRRTVFVRALKAFGIGNYAYVNAGRHFPPFYIEHTYPAAWVEHYMRQNYQDSDVVARSAKRANLPFQWRPLLDQPAVDAAAQTVFDEAAAFDILDGMTIPIHGADGFAMMSMVINDNKLFTVAGMPLRNALHMMALYYHDTVEKRAAEAMAAEAEIRLSPREREVLTWSARGKSSWEISQVLKLSERTVVFHMENAKGKLGVTSRSHATVKAIMLGLISP